MQKFSWNLGNFNFEVGFKPATYRLQIYHFSHSAIDQTQAEMIGDILKIFDPCQHLLEILVCRAWVSLCFTDFKKSIPAPLNPISTMVLQQNKKSLRTN
jgi:hypothetical protein